MKFLGRFWFSVSGQLVNFSHLTAKLPTVEGTTPTFAVFHHIIDIRAVFTLAAIILGTILHYSVASLGRLASDDLEGKFGKRSGYYSVCAHQSLECKVGLLQVWLYTMETSWAASE